MHAPKASMSLIFCLAISLAMVHAHDQDFLAVQNELRQRMGAPALAWNESMAVRARGFANSTNCGGDKTKLRASPPDQINFYSKEKNLDDAIKNFENSMDWESFGYVAETNSCPEESGYPCPNFPKMASPTVTSVGCGSHPFGAGTLIVCMYSSPPSPLKALMPVSDRGYDL